LFLKEEEEEKQPKKNDVDAEKNFAFLVVLKGVK